MTCHQTNASACTLVILMTRVMHGQCMRAIRRLRILTQAFLLPPPHPSPCLKVLHSTFLTEVNKVLQPASSNLLGCNSSQSVKTAIKQSGENRSKKGPLTATDVMCKCIFYVVLNPLKPSGNSTYDQV
jgi:hypothetical protein